MVKNSKKQQKRSARYRNSKYSPNVYDVSVITAFVMLLVTVTYVSVGPSPYAQAGSGQLLSNTVGQAGALTANTGGTNIICVKNNYGDIICSSVGELVEADGKVFSSCVSEYGCAISCAELTTACTERGSFSACALQNKFC